MNLFESFKKALKLKDYSGLYVYPVKNFLTYCSEKGIDPLKISYEELSDFILQIKEKHKNGYVNNFIKALKCFYSCMYDFDYISKDKTSPLTQINKFTLLRVEHKIKDTIDFKQLNDILKVAVNYGYPMTPYRMRAILYFMYFTGVRRGELINLKRSAIDLENLSAIIRVPTKNKSEKIVYFPDAVKEALTDYFSTEPEEKNAFNLSHAILMHFFTFLKNFAPKKVNLTAHSFRHSYTQMLMNKGVDIRIIQELLGHKSLSSTLLYCNPTQQTVENIYRKKIKCKATTQETE